MKSNKIFAGSCLLALVFAFAGEQAIAATCNNGNNNKAAISQSQNNTVYTEGATVTLDANLGSSRPAPAQGGVYSWSQISGPAITLVPVPGTNSTSVTFVAPHVNTGSNGVVVVQLSVTGSTCTGPGAGVPGTDTISVNLANLNNFPPVAVASASAANVSPGTLVTLSSAGSYDPDNNPVTFLWSQTAGPAVTLSSTTAASVGFTAPVVASTTTLTFSLRVTEDTLTFPGQGAKLFTTTSVSVNVVVVASNQPPTAGLSCPASVNEGLPFTLNGAASNDPENGPLSYAYSQIDGFPLITLPPGPYGNTLGLVAPQLGAGQPGNVSFRLVVTDNGNASAQAECTVFINDVTAPVISGADNILLEATSPAGATATFSPTALDNVNGPLIPICSPASGTVFALGNTTVNCAVDDSSGNIGTASFIVSVVDTTAPVIAPHAGVFAEATSASGASVAYTSPATSDIVDGAGTANCLPASGSTFALGDSTVTCNASDVAGNPALATGFTVNVSDSTAPVVTPPADVVAEATGVLTVVAYGTATATDDVGVVTLVSDAPPSFPLGETTITWTATDAATNSSIATSKVTVVDTTGPVIAAHADEPAVEATGPAGAAVNYTSPTANDLVDGPVAVSCVPASGSTFALGTNGVTCNASDAAGNAAAPTTFNVTVVDTTPPVIAAHGDENAEATGPAGAAVNYTLPTASDVVDVNVFVTCLPASGSTFALGTNPVTCNASDASGNAAAPTSFNVIVVDTTPPVIDAHGDENAEATSPAGAAVNYTSPTANDLVDGPVAVSCVPASGSTFALGTNGVTCNASDAAGNDAAPTTFNVTVVDTTPPVIAAHGDENAEATGPAGAAVNYTLPTASDVVDVNVFVTCLPASGSTFALGTNPVTCNASDASGNAAAPTSFNVIVVDTTPPVIDAHGDENAEATSPAGAAVNYTSPTANDLVDGPVAVSCVPASGSTFALGTNGVTCNASDAAGNAATPTTFNVTVVDTTSPVIAAQGNLSAEATGPAGAAVSYTSPMASDVVSGSWAASCLPASGSTFALGTHAVTCNATDGAGNAATPTTFNVTVVDTTAPVIAAHANVTALATSAAGAVVTYTLPTASDLVDGSVAVTCLPASGGTFAIGATTVNCSATDSHSNTGHSSFTVTVSYNFTGFFKPVDNLPIVNVVKAGSAIPVKFSLGGNMGLGIMAAGYPKSASMNCSSGVQDVVEETVTAGGSSLSYDGSQYVYVWKSEKTWGGTCRQLQVKLIDGTTQVANFNFSR